MCEALASGARCAVEPTDGYVYTVRPYSISSRLTEGDRKLLVRYKFSPEAARMQKRQECDLQEYCSYVKLADALKRGDITGALKAAVERPLTVRQPAAWRRVDRWICF